MHPTHLLPALVGAALVSGVSLSAAPKLNVVATLPDLAAIAREIGGEHLVVTSLAQGMEDPHFVDPKPSFVRVLNKANLLLEGGADLEAGWLPPLVNAARNPRILRGASGNMLAAQGVRMLEVPAGGVDRSQGDVHPFGNPHFLLDPGNARVVAGHLAEVLGQLDTANAASYRAGLKRFEERLAQKEAEWTRLLEPFRGTAVITYHKSFDYFCRRFGFKLAGTIEPKPGIEPSPAHINALIPLAKSSGVKLVLIEPNRPRRTPERVAQAVGARLLIVPLMPGGHEKAKDFFSWFDYNVSQTAAALKP